MKKRNSRKPVKQKGVLYRQTARGEFAYDIFEEYLQIYTRLCPILNLYCKGKYPGFSSNPQSCYSGICLFKDLGNTGKAQTERCASTADTFIIMNSNYNSINNMNNYKDPILEDKSLGKYTVYTHNGIALGVPTNEFYCGHVFVIVEHNERYYLIQSFIYNYPARVVRITEKRKKEIEDFFQYGVGQATINTNAIYVGNQTYSDLFQKFTGMELKTYQGNFIPGLQNVQFTKKEYYISETFVLRMLRSVVDYHKELLNATNKDLVQRYLGYNDPFFHEYAYLPKDGEEFNRVLRERVHDAKNCIFYVINTIVDSMYKNKPIINTSLETLIESTKDFSVPPEWVNNINELRDYIVQIPSMPTLITPQTIYEIAFMIKRGGEEYTIQKLTSEMENLMVENENLKQQLYPEMEIEEIPETSNDIEELTADFGKMTINAKTGAKREREDYVEKPRVKIAKMSRPTRKALKSRKRKISRVIRRGKNVH